MCTGVCCLYCGCLGLCFKYIAVYLHRIDDLDNEIEFNLKKLKLMYYKEFVCDGGTHSSPFDFTP